MKKFTISALALAFLALVFTAALWQSKPVAAADDNNNDECRTVEILPDAVETSSTGTNVGEFALETTGTGTGTIVNSTNGTGSFQLSTPNAADKVDLKTTDYAGRLLSQLTSLSYSAYRTAGSAQQDAAVKIEVDSNGTAPGGYTTLVFEPVYNTNQGTVTNNTLQNFDAVRNGSAVYYSTHDLYDANNTLVACNPGGALASTSQCAGKLYVTLATIEAGLPNAMIYTIGLGQGSGNAGLTTLVDNFNIGFNHSCVTYNFEQLSSTDQQNPQVQACKNGGFAKQTDPRTSEYFRNQGQCVSYYAKQNHATPTPTPTATPRPSPSTSPSPTTSPSPMPSPSPTVSPSPSPTVDRGAPCRNGGWRTLRDSRGRYFRSQGQCLDAYGARGDEDEDDD